MRSASVAFPLREIVMMQVAGRAGDRWQVREDELWCHASPAGYPSRVQGWKLHVSATWLSAPLVLHQAAQVLVAHGCAFKFAATLSHAWELCQKQADRAQAGKFLTAYPRDDDQLRELAPLLDRATAGLPGPAILSDRPFREGSLVHYRYGAFAGVPVLTNEGLFQARLEAPDGALVEDARQPWFCPPPWAELPFDGPPGRASRPPSRPKAVLLAGRFRVDWAISHTASGGVYRATDQHTGERVVIKQARAHIGGFSRAGDARDGLRHESAMLAELAGLAPREVLLFEDGPDLFLATEALDGEPFSEWVSHWWHEPAGPDPELEGPPVTQGLVIAERLADTVDAVHARGLVFRDFSPTNVMVLTDGSLRLVDAELVARPGDWVSYAQTPGFAPPELGDGSAAGPAPGPEADHYALGAMLCFLGTGMAPAFPPDVPARHGSGGGDPDPPASGSAAGSTGSAPTTGERIESLLAYAAARSPSARRLAGAVCGLTAEDPEQRWDTGRLRAFLAAPEPPEPAEAGADPAPVAGGRPAAGDGRLEPERQRRLVEDGLAYLAAVVRQAAPERLVPNGEYGASSDPCNVQHGAAGVLAVLVRGSELLGGEPLRAAVRSAARWIDRRRTDISPLLPGLYFGRSGTAWALHDAARHLDDAGLAERALELAAALPVRWDNPDITHGTAGAGMASLYLWRRSGEPAMRDRVDTAVDHLLERVSHTEDGQVYWQVAPEFDSMLAGVTHLGFAHGVAGIGAFLLAAGQATGRDDAVKLASQAGDTLVDTAVRSAGSAYWPNDVFGPDPSDLRYQWCSGASGVGTFLARLGWATGETRFQELAHEAAVAVHRSRWFNGVAACHGLAGNAEFLLDLAATGEPPYRHWAEELAACLYLRGARHHGRLVVIPEERGLNLDFNTGFAGVVGFALRLVHGGPRWWMVDPPGPDPA